MANWIEQVHYPTPQHFFLIYFVNWMRMRLLLLGPVIIKQVNRIIRKTRSCNLNLLGLPLSTPSFYVKYEFHTLYDIIAFPIVYIHGTTKINTPLIHYIPLTIKEITPFNNIWLQYLTAIKPRALAASCYLELWFISINPSPLATSVYIKIRSIIWH